MTPNQRRARIALTVGAIALAAAAALFVWDASADDPAPSVVITGDND